MTRNEEEELLFLIRDNNFLLKQIWTSLNNPNNDAKGFLINLIANNIGNRR